MDPNEEEVDSGGDVDDDDELLVPKSPVPEEIRSYDSSDDYDNDEDDGDQDEEDGRNVGDGLEPAAPEGERGMKKVFAMVMDVGEEAQEDEPPPALPPTLPPLIVTEDVAHVETASGQSTQPAHRPVPILMPSLVYAPRPYSAPKKISP